jgi:divalent metal cation (Fe/Co/Zn/Cd) transporter
MMRGAGATPICETSSDRMEPDEARARLVRRGRLLSYVTLGYNLLEGIASLLFGTVAGSIALVGFGIDSLLEVTSSLAALWRLRADLDVTRRAAVERASLRVIGACFLGLAIYIFADAVHALLKHEPPTASIPGMLVAAFSVVIMPMLARAKRHVAIGLASRALEADATQTDLCMYLSVIVLSGLALNALFGWWWADPIAALMMTPFITKEGISGLRGEDCCDDCRRLS